MPAPLLHSDTATGTIGHEWTWTANAYSSFARHYIYPPSPPNPNPTGNALLVKTLTIAWHQFTPAQKTLWNRLAKAKRLPPYTVFIGYNLRRFYMKLPPVNQPE